MAWAGWFGQEKKKRQLNIYQCVATNQKRKNSSNTIVNFPILTPFSRHFLRHKFPLGSTILKYTLSQSVCSIHYTWPIVSNPVSSIIHATTTRFMAHALMTFNCRGAQGTRAENPDTIGCVWTGELDLNTLRVDGEIFESSAKKKLQIREYHDTCGRGLSF